MPHLHFTCITLKYLYMQNSSNLQSIPFSDKNSLCKIVEVKSACV